MSFENNNQKNEILKKFNNESNETYILFIE